MPSIADRLNQLRRGLFVGCLAEQTVFAAALAAPTPPRPVINVHGVGGVGKTSLLARFRDQAQELGALAISLDRREFAGPPSAFLAALAAKLPNEAKEADPSHASLNGWAAVAQARDALAERLAALAARRRLVLLFDTYEEWSGLDDWLREAFVPYLDANVLLVIAGRAPLTGPWTEEPAWRQLIEPLPLGELSVPEAEAYLRAEGLRDPEVARAIIHLTHGHPLTLSLAADLAVRLGVRDFAASSEGQDVLRRLAERLLRDVPDPALRELLEAASVVRRFDEELLGSLLAVAPERAAFARLCALILVRPIAGGLSLHENLREALASTLKWRQPERYQTLRHRALAYYQKRLSSTEPGAAQRAAADLGAELLYLSENRVVRQAFFGEPSTPSVRLRAPHAAELDALVAIVRGYHSRLFVDEQALALFEADVRACFLETPEAFRLAVARDDRVLGFNLAIPIEWTSLPLLERLTLSKRYARQLGPEDRARLAIPDASLGHFAVPAYYPLGDPLVESARVALFQDVLRLYGPGRRLATASYDPATKRLLQALGYVAVRGTRHTDLHPDWPMEAFELDFARQDFAAWAERMALGLPPPPRPASQLSAAELAEELRRALLRIRQPDLLAASPLVGHNLVVQHAGAEATPRARGQALAAALAELIDKLAQEQPEVATVVRVLPEQQHKRAEGLALKLGLSLSTYYRYQKRGLGRLAALLAAAEA